MASLTETIQKPVDVVRRLERQVRELESLQRVHTGVVSSGCEAMDSFLPLGGYSRGSLVEFLTDRGMSLGLTTIALQIAKSVCSDGKYIVVIDPELQIFPPALKQLGVPLERLICLRPGNHADLIWGLDQTLRSGSVGTVIASIQRLDDRGARRIQLAAEAGGGLGILLRSLESVRHQASWAEVQWLVQAATPKPDLQDCETRWFDWSLRRSPGSHALAQTANHSVPPAVRERFGNRLRLGVDSQGRWAVPQEHSQPTRLPTPPTTATPIQREAWNEQTGHVRMAAELASPTRLRRNLAS